MSDPYYVYRPLLDLTGFTEGTDKGRGYNETLAYGAYTGGQVDLVSMTLDQIDALQTKMLMHPKNKWNSSAVGRYQIVRTTLREIRGALNLPGTALFDRSMQDRLACFLLGRRGIDRYIAGRMSRDDMINALAKEWASLPTTSGKGAYGGQHAAVSVAVVIKVLAEVEERAGQKPQQKPADALSPKSVSVPAPSSNRAPAPAQESKRGLLVKVLAALGIGTGTAGAAKMTQVEADQLAAFMIMFGMIAIAAIIIVVIRRRK